MIDSLRLRCLIFVGLLWLAWPTAAQVQFGDFSTNLNGVISGGYTGNYGNESTSAHSWTAGGSADFTGYFYNPNFLSFDVTPYYNQSTANSNFQSITNASGVNASSSIFSGGQFPGSVYYAKSYNSEGNYGIPGITSYSTHGDSQTFGVNWNELLPGKPSLSASFGMGDTQYSIYGLQEEGSSSFRTYNVSSGYRFHDFNLGAFFSGGEGSSEVPELLSTEQETHTHSDNTNFGFNAGHALPWNGMFQASFTRSDVNTEYLGFNYSGTIDMVTATAGVQPTQKLHLSVSTTYSDNLVGQLYQTVLPGSGTTATGGVATTITTPAGISSSQSSNSFDLLGVASYSFAPNLQTTVFGDRRVQNYLGESFEESVFGGSVSYGRGLLGGNFNAATTIQDEISDTSNANVLGFNVTANYSRNIFGWRTSFSGNYAQNMQTVLITYTNSNYGYSATTNRHWGRFSVGFGAAEGRSGLTEQRGLENHGSSYTAHVGYGQWITLAGNYNTAYGQALATGAGLVPVPLPPVIPPDLLFIFGGKGYGATLGSSPVKRMTISASYGKTNSNYSNEGVVSWNHYEYFNALMLYQFRKVYITAGYSRLEQGFSGSGLPPAMISSFYMGVSRWFNFF